MAVDTRLCWELGEGHRGELLEDWEESGRGWKGLEGGERPDSDSGGLPAVVVSLIEKQRGWE